MYPKRVYLLLSNFLGATLLTLGALVLTYVLMPLIGNSMFLFMATAVLSAWLGGLGPGLLATVLSIFLANYFFIEPRHALLLNWVDVLHLTIFSGVIVLISWIERSRSRSVRHLEQAYEQINVILENVSDGISAQKSPGDFIYANAASAHLLNFSSAEEMLQTPLAETHQRLEFFDEKGEPLPVEALPTRRALREGISVEKTLQMRDEAASLDRWLYVKSAPVFDQENRVQLVVNIFRDVTERRAIERARARLASIIDNSDDAIIGKALDGTILSWNPAAERLYGYKPQEAIGRPISIIFPEDIRLQEAALLDRLQHGERIDHYETVRIHKDGTRIHISLTISPIRDTWGKIIGYSTIERDITEKWLHQKRLRDLINNLSVFVVLLNSDGTIVEINPTALALADHPPEAITGKSLDQVWEFTEEIQIPLCEAVQLAASGETVHYNAQVINAKNALVAMDFTIGPILDTQGEVAYLVASGVDITAHKRVEHELALHTIELRQSNEELERFAHVASHDLQEPLRMVISYLQLLELRYRDQLDQDAKDFIDFAVDGAARMKALISDLLAYSRVQQSEKTFQPVQMQCILDQALDNLQVTIEDNRATVVQNSPMPEVVADKSQILQVWQNLLSNALKFRSEASPEIYIDAVRRDDRWVFSVRDNGIGIESQHLERIFVIFQRLHTNREYPGTGIGLAICKKIVEQHGGTIWIESTPEQGTTVYFTIPAR